MSSTGNDGRLGQWFVGARRSGAGLPAVTGVVSCCCLVCEGRYVGGLCAGLVRRWTVQVYMHMHSVHRRHRVCQGQKAHGCPVHVCRLDLECSGTESGRLKESRVLVVTGIGFVLQLGLGCVHVARQSEPSRSCMTCPKRLGICAPAQAWSPELRSVEYRCAVSTAGGALGWAVN